MAEDGRYLRSQILAVREMYTSDEWFDYALTRYKDCFENELLSKVILSFRDKIILEIDTYFKIICDIYELQ